MEDQVTSETLNNDTNKDKEQPSVAADDLQFLRSELITLAEKHEIKHSVAYIKKANYIALEKIKAEYERKQLQGANMIDEAKSMEEELSHNKLVKRDLKNILGYVTPYIPLIGLVCGISIVGKHMYNRKTET